MTTLTSGIDAGRKLCAQDDYDGERIYTGSERYSLKLPASYTRTSADDLTGVKDLARMSEEELVGILTGTAPQSLRYHAGLILSLHGDPRILPRDPAMVRIAGGTYPVGSTMAAIDEALADYAHLGVERKWLVKEFPRHEARLPAYLIAKYPVTNGEYLAFLLATGYSGLPTSWVLGRFPTERRNHPVFNVLPEDAMAYVAWLNRETGRQFRLPTEYEWEVAASGGDGRQYPWGDRFDPSFCNTVEGNVLGSTPVGMYAGMAPVAHGLCDMAGNVEEYVSDDYRPYPGGEAIKDHLNEETDHYRVARGGSFGRFGDLARCQRRHGLFPRSVRAIFPMGFRLAETAA